ncbi:unnamed protein product [Prorocentrum cordatum]|uniref:Uncharacterized protein n=1 Tax=Prorocentrum cordatum TaxID=2364126 RepID=A0ABN9QMI9_9DINO|nr:unnamed protein product [Polarella glacialis]
MRARIRDERPAWRGGQGRLGRQRTGLAVAACAALSVGALAPRLLLVQRPPARGGSWTRPARVRGVVGRLALQDESAAYAARAEAARKGQQAFIPDEVGQSSNEVGFEQLCTRWNREEAEAVQISKRTLQSPDTTVQQKLRAVDELEYWAIRRGGYDAEIVLIGTLKSADRQLAGQAHVALKKTWNHHFNAWVNSAIGTAKSQMNDGHPEKAIQCFDKVIFQNPLWGEGYHLRAKCYNQLGDVNQTFRDLRSALEFCPNNYVTMVELALALIDKKQAYEEASELLQQAWDLCPLLPIDAFSATLYAKAPHLRPKAPLASDEVSIEDVPERLLPGFWVERAEATERPNQAFLRLGAELEQWFQKLLQQNPTRAQQRKLWSVLVIKWDPDKFPRPLRSFTTQVHELLKARRERELSHVRRRGKDKHEVWAAAVDPYAEGDSDDEEEVEEEVDGDDARSFLRRLRAERRKAAQPAR